jgi:hypothetical protein
MTEPRGFCRVVAKFADQWIGRARWIRTASHGKIKLGLSPDCVIQTMWIMCFWLFSCGHIQSIPCSNRCSCVRFSPYRQSKPECLFQVLDDWERPEMFNSPSACACTELWLVVVSFTSRTHYRTHTSTRPHTSCSPTATPHSHPNPHPFTTTLRILWVPIFKTEDLRIQSLFEKISKNTKTQNFKQFRISLRVATFRSDHLRRRCTVKSCSEPIVIFQLFSDSRVQNLKVFRSIFVFQQIDVTSLRRDVFLMKITWFEPQGCQLCNKNLFYVLPMRFGIDTLYFTALR